MLGVFKQIFSFLNKHLTGKTWEREMNHPYFGQMIISDPKILRNATGRQSCSFRISPKRLVLP
jgi:hypothetical protein